MIRTMLFTAAPFAVMPPAQAGLTQAAAQLLMRDCSARLHDVALCGAVSSSAIEASATVSHCIDVAVDRTATASAERR